MSKSDARANSYRLSSVWLATRLQPSAIALPNILELAMNRKLNIAIAATASLISVSAAQAASSKVLDQMMDTCIQQFVTTNLADFKGKVTVQKSDKQFHYGPLLVAGSGSYRITVAAVRRPGDTQLATATCSMARDGSVISIKSTPLAALKQLPRAQPVIVASNEVK
jgi:hypothetical protein